MLTDHERALLDFEDANPQQNWAKTHAMRERFGLTPTAYYVAINGLVRTADAVMEVPQVVHRLARRSRGNAGGGRGSSSGNLVRNQSFAPPRPLRGNVAVPHRIATQGMKRSPTNVAPTERIMTMGGAP